MALLLGLACNLAQTFVTKAAAQTQSAATLNPPTVVPRPTRAAVIVYSDDFSQLDSGWSSGRDKGFVYSYVDGAYLVTVPQRDAIAIGRAHQQFDHAVLSVDVRYVSGDVDSTSALIAWRVQDNANYYALLLSDDGYFRVSRFEEGELKTLYDWKTHPALHHAGQVNHVDVAFEAESATIYINDVFATRIVDNTFTSGDIGLGGYASEDSSLEVAFDNIIVYDIESWKPPTPN